MPKVIDEIKSSEKCLLLLQGGAMRGVYSTGAMCALSDLGLTSNFSNVVGESAGAVNGAYFVARQATKKAGWRIYTRYLNNKKFINKRKFPEVLDIDYMESVIRNKVKLDVEEIILSPIKLHVALTKYPEIKQEMYTLQDEEIINAIKATAAVPIIYNKPVRVHDDYYVDGGLAGAIPYEYAKSLDYEIMVVILTNPLGYRYEDSRIKQKFVSSEFAQKKYGKKILDAVDTLDDKYNAVLEQIEKDSADPHNKIYVVSPSHPKDLVGMLQTDRYSLSRTRSLGYTDMFNLMYSPSSIHQVGPWSE